MATIHNIRSYNICTCTCSFDKCNMMATHIFPIQDAFTVISKIFSRSFAINTWFWCLWFFPSSWLFCGIIWSALFTKALWRAIIVKFLVIFRMLSHAMFVLASCYGTVYNFLLSDVIRV